jgi:N-acetylmuramoyl-L-alanine amidase
MHSPMTRIWVSPWRALAGLALLASPLAYFCLAGIGEASDTPLRQCAQSAFRVVLDVGHTPEAPGAMSARGVSEFHFNLHLAQVIEAKLIAGGFDKTVLLRTNGRAKSALAERVERANALGANLFISIHHDSVPEFLKAGWEYEGHPRKFSDKFKGHSIFVSSKNSKPTASLNFARLLGRELKEQGLQYTPHYSQGFMGHWQRQLVDAETGVYRYDQLVVLRTTRMPAVLLEAGSIVNREEEILVTSPDRQAQIAAAILHAVEQFCSRVPVPSVSAAGSARPAQ